MATRLVAALGVGVVVAATLRVQGIGPAALRVGVMVVATLGVQGLVAAALGVRVVVAALGVQDFMVVTLGVLRRSVAGPSPRRLGAMSWRRRIGSGSWSHYLRSIGGNASFLTKVGAGGGGGRGGVNLVDR